MLFSSVAARGARGSGGLPGAGDLGCGVDADDRGRIGQTELSGETAVAVGPVNRVRDGDDGALERVGCGEVLRKQRDRTDFIRFPVYCLLSEHETAGGHERRNEMERRVSGGAIGAAPRGPAVDRDELAPVGPAVPHPGGKVGRERHRMDPVHQ